MYLYFPDDELCDYEKFPIPREFSSSIEDLESGADDMLKRSRLDPQTIVNIGYFKFVASRLPLPTTGLELEVRVFSGELNGPRKEYFLRIDGRSLQLVNVECFEGECSCLESSIDTVLECGTWGNFSGDDYPPVAIMERLENWMREWREHIRDESWKISLKCNVEDFDWEDQTVVEDPWEYMPYFSY
jgi:hypothetical protein